MLKEPHGHLMGGAQQGQDAGLGYYQQVFGLTVLVGYHLPKAATIPAMNMYLTVTSEKHRAGKAQSAVMPEMSDILGGGAWGTAKRSSGPAPPMPHGIGGACPVVY